MKINKEKLIILFLLVSMILLIYFPTISTLISTLIDNDDYSHGLLIPIVSIYIIYQRREKIKNIHWQPNFLGLLFLLFGLSLQIIGEIAADLYVPRISFIISLGGVILFVCGSKFIKALLFPLLLLILMIPLPQLVTNKLTMPLQLISSQLATFFFQLMGIPVFRQGNIIDLGVRQMQIVDACSGLRYILALLALGVIFCYFYQRKLWKILILQLILLPATIFANALRVTAMGLYPALLEGFWHAFSGWLIFIFCFGILALANLILNKISPPEEKTKTFEADLSPSRDSFERKRIWTSVALSVIIVLLFIPVTKRASIAPNYPIKKGFESFPLLIDSWQGRHAFIDPSMVAATQSHAHLNMDFIKENKEWISLWIAYYETQKKAGGFVHSPKGCFVASGWQIEKTKVIDIAEGKQVNWMIVNRSGTKLLVYYWFLQRGRWLADETMNKFYMAYDGFLKRRTDGALIRLITAIDGDIEIAQRRLTAFAQAIDPILNNYIPD